MAKCNRFVSYLRYDGIVGSGTYCDGLLSGGVELQPNLPWTFWDDFGPPNYNDYIRRNPRDCHPNQPGCRLYCGMYGGRQMHILYEKLEYNRERNIVQTGTYEQVYGLKLQDNGPWLEACQTCAGNLANTGFIKSGWYCRNVDTEVNIYATFDDPNL